MKLGKYRIIKEKEYQELIRTQRYWDEREQIIKDNDIQKEKEKLEKKYKKYFGRWFNHEDGFSFQIRGIYYNSSNYYTNKFEFDCYVPNWIEPNIEVDIDGVIDGKYDECKKGDLF